jgi:N-acetylglucosamine-6-phosphate deacetylase
VTDLLLAGGTSYTPAGAARRAWIHIGGGVIIATGDGTPPAIAGATRIDTTGQIVAPGFVDLHVHGGGGADVMDGSPDALRTVARAHAAGGTTAWTGSTVAAPPDDLLRVLEVAAGTVGQPLDGATLLGIHLEGPFLNAAQRGAHRAEHVRTPAPAEVRALFARLRGHSRVTAAPEVAGVLDMAPDARRYGLHCAIGHSDASLEAVRAALAAGFTHVTHLYSCTSGLRIEGGYKYPGINEAALLLDEITVELIGDGHHVPPALIQLVHKVKGADRVCLVTDAMRAAGLPPGDYRLGDMDVIVEDGVAKLPDRSKFAGSVCTMDQAVRTAVAAGIPLEDALRMASATPATLLGVADRKGAIAPGMDADLVVLDQELRTQMTIVGGRVVFEGNHYK